MRGTQSLALPGVWRVVQPYRLGAPNGITCSMARPIHSSLIEDGDDAAIALATEARMATEGGVPGEVVKAMIEDGLSPLAAWRKHRGFTQADLAKRAGLSQVWVGRIEAGGGYGSRATRRKLAEALDAPLWAMEDEGRR